MPTYLTCRQYDPPDLWCANCKVNDSGHCRKPLEQRSIPMPKPERQIRIPGAGSKIFGVVTAVLLCILLVSGLTWVIVEIWRSILG